MPNAIVSPLRPDDVAAVEADALEAVEAQRFRRGTRVERPVARSTRARPPACAT